MILKLYVLLFILNTACLQFDHFSALNIYNVRRNNDLNIDQEQLLLDKLLKSYNKKIRPPGTLQVKFSLNLNQIIKLIEKDQIIVMNAFIDHEWIDKRLSWGNMSS